MRREFEFISPPSKRFHLIIKRLARYKAELKIIPFSFKPLISPSDEILGVYEGDIESENIIFTRESIIFTERSLGAAISVQYCDIASIEFPLPTSSSTSLVLQLNDDQRLTCNVIGVDGKFRDVFTVGNFLMKVADHVERNN